MITTGYLPHWSLRFHKRSKDRSGKCNIHSGSDGVYFALYEISAKDKVTLDKIEGVGFGYSNISLSFPDSGDCASYIAEETHVDESLQPYDWYKELVLIGAEFHGFPDDYLKRIEAIQTIRDPDPSRRVREWTTVELIKAGR